MPARFDGWTIHTTDLYGVSGEVFDPPTRTVLVDPAGTGRLYAIEHVKAHLRLRHHLHGRRLTDAECEAADAEAERVLSIRAAA